MILFLTGLMHLLLLSVIARLPKQFQTIVIPLQCVSPVLVKRLHDMLGVLNALQPIYTYKSQERL
ncbi:hypothetical protein OSCI_3860015 [Kamptonema sp. PCC 6506]|nr:hypothetical protein OSCI_3860015 [Kamptonema sp. PCC 6506]